LRGLLVALALALASGPAAAQNTNDPRDAKTSGKSNWEIEQEERAARQAEVALPALPRPEGLIEFFVSSASSFRFFIDGASLSVAPDGTVRYTLVARSARGYDNVSYEAIRCRSNLYRVYARADGGAWSRSDSEWRPIEQKSVQRWHNELRDQYFCPLGLAILSVDEGMRALRAGGHPLVPANSDLRR
jgi:hypothetical protein